jgi:hypothetical protein
VNNELEKMWKGKVKVLPWHLPGGTDEEGRNPR